jgi:radical SAM/Cys-rich protein
MTTASFARTLQSHGLELVRGQTHTLQVNLGLVCNQTCRHCHLEAGPHRHESMDRQTMLLVARYAREGGFTTVDITGGAPELNPHLPELLRRVRPHVERLLLRVNLTALGEHSQLMPLLAELKVVLMASLPAANPTQTDAQRGEGVFERSLAVLARLNRLGYGQPGSELELNLITNPAGAFLPPPQARAEEDFRRRLARRGDIRFHHLFALANVPLGRFRRWLRASGNYRAYLDRLRSAFNPCTVEGLMCRQLVSVAWDGQLYDCDFNLALGLPLGGRPTHVSQVSGPPAPGSPIAVGEHCFACTAGSGFT